MRTLTIALCVATWALCASAANATRVRPLALPVTDQRVLDSGPITGGTTAWSTAGDVAVLWRNGSTVRLATRAVGGRFLAPLVLPGAASAEGSSLEGPVVGVGGGVLATWRNGTPEDGETLQVAASYPGTAPGLLAPLATPGGASESPRAEWRTIVGPDGAAMMAVERGDAVRITERRPGGNFGPEVVVSAPGELPGLTSVRMIRDDAGGVIITWTSKMPCVALTAPRCLVNRVATRAAGAAGFGVPQSLAEVPTGLRPVPRVPTPQFTALRRVGPKAVQRFTGPGAIMRDGSVLVEYGRGCGPGRGTNSEIAVVKPGAAAQVTRRIAPCGARAPTLIDSRGALVTLSLDGPSPDSAILRGSATCPIPPRSRRSAHTDAPPAANAIGGQRGPQPAAGDVRGAEITAEAHAELAAREERSAVRRGSSPRGERGVDTTSPAASHGGCVRQIHDPRSMNLESSGIERRVVICAVTCPTPPRRAS